MNGIPSWPSGGFTFCTWLCIDEEPNKDDLSRSSVLFSFMDATGNSVELRIENEEVGDATTYISNFVLLT